MADRKILFRSSGNLNEVSPTADIITVGGVTTKDIFQTGIIQGSSLVGAQRMWVIQQEANATTLAQYGLTAAPTTEGSVSVLDTTTGQFIQYQGATGVNNDAGWVSAAFTQTRLNYLPFYESLIRTGADITSIRYWFGLFSADPMAITAGTLHQLGFRYSTDVDGTAFWRTTSNNGATPTVTTTTTAITASTAYRLTIIARSTTSVDFMIDGVTVATHTTALPTATTNMGHVEQSRQLVSGGRQVCISKVSVSQRSA